MTDTPTPAPALTAHQRDDMGICTRCGHGVTAVDLVDGEKQCPAPALTDAEVRAAWMAQYDESRDGGHVVAAERARFNRWLVSVRRSAARAVAEKIAQQAENRINRDPGHAEDCAVCHVARLHADDARTIGGAR